jgi:hypothetical protein
MEKQKLTILNDSEKSELIGNMGIEHMLNMEKEESEFIKRIKIATENCPGSKRILVINSRKIIEVGRDRIMRMKKKGQAYSYPGINFVYMN